EILQRIDDDFPNRVAQVIDKTYEDQLVVSVISSQIDADRMDYLLRDAYYTGVSYGQFDMERILRVMRPTKDKVVIKSTGMHAVEDYIMSRYQIYEQVYVQRETRSADTILVKIFDRVKYLYQSGYTFNMAPVLLLYMFKESPLLEEYLRLDESVFHFYFFRWQEESDPTLSDLSIRFMNRQLVHYGNYSINIEI